MSEFDDEVEQFQEDQEFQNEERTKAMLVHLKSLAFPLLGFLGAPLILRKRLNDVGPYLKKHWDAAFNFQLTIAVYAGAIYALAIIAGSTIHDFVGEGRLSDWFVMCLLIATLALFVFWFLMTIRAAIRAKCGLEPPYPRLPFGVHQEEWGHSNIDRTNYPSDDPI